MEQKTIIKVVRAPKDSPARYVTVTQSGQILNAWTKLSDISAYYRARDPRRLIQLERDLNTTYAPELSKVR